MKRWAALLCMMMMLPVCVLAAEMPAERGAVECTVISGGISGDAALEGFINQAFGIGKGTRKPSDASKGTRLTGADAALYAELAEYAAQVANGERSSTVFEIPMENLIGATAFTAEELGVERVYDETYDEESHTIHLAINGKAKAALLAKLPNVSLVISALLVDDPYNFYWFDKTVGYSWACPEYTVTYEPATIYFTSDMYTVSMCVAKEYSVSGTMGTTQYDTGCADSILQAAETAKSVVRQHAGKSDYGKLKAYKEAICDLVDYNDAAAENSATPYGNPWQLIWVFDGDPATKVVCEGYSKAFKYLCDMSSFQDAEAMIVSGTMAGGTGAGRHMWNLVRKGGARYLVDVTNCDSSTDGSISVGYPDQLFMAGYSDLYSDGSVHGYIYEMDNGQQVIYVYNDDMYDLYAAEDLDVSETAYEPQASIFASAAQVQAEEEFVLTVEVPGQQEIHVGRYDGNNVCRDLYGAGEEGETAEFRITEAEPGEYVYCAGYYDEENGEFIWTEATVQVTVTDGGGEEPDPGAELEIGAGYLRERVYILPLERSGAEPYSEEIIGAFAIRNEDAFTDQSGSPVWTVENVSGTHRFEVQPTDGGLAAELALMSMPSGAETAEFRIACTWGESTWSETYTVEFRELSSCPNGMATPVRDGRWIVTAGEGQDLDALFTFADGWYIPGEADAEITADFVDADSAVFWENCETRLQEATGTWLCYVNRPGVYGVTVAVRQLNTCWPVSFDLVVLNEDGSIPPDYYTVYSPAASVLRLPENLKRIEGEAFANISTERIEIPASCEYIATGAFAGLQHLKEIRMAGAPDNWENAFDDLTGVILLVNRATPEEVKDTARSLHMILLPEE